MIPKVTLECLIHSPLNFIAFGLGSGLSPVAPGTCGTLMSIPLYYLFSRTSAMIYSSFIIASFIFGIYVSTKAEQFLKYCDHPAIVIDEIVGYLTAMYLIPPSLCSTILGFMLFRLFDVIKPWPIKLIDSKVHGGFGIMIDDIVAAVFTGIILNIIQFYV